MKQRWCSYFRSRLVKSSVLFVGIGALTASALAQHLGHDPAAVEAAKEYSRRLAEVKPVMDRAEKLYNLGRFREADEECQKAISWYESIGPEYAAFGQVLKAEIEIALGMPEEAIGRLKPLLDGGMKGQSILVGLALGHFQLRQYAQGLQYLDEAIQLASRQFTHSNAWPDLVQLRSGNPRTWQALALVIRAEQWAGVPERALRDLQTAKNLAPANLGVRYCLGLPLHGLHRWADAKAELRLAAQSSGPLGPWAREFLRSAFRKPE